ncbi:MAG: hypothetical protein KDK74_15350, partial [Cephaloticoccus sp.]|nr:hypothetical protein [Cephaloticoccus sp.]
FFCLPFGGNETPWRGERHPAHGETAGGAWRLLGLTHRDRAAELRAELRPRARPGRVLKRLALRSGETNVYCRHELHGFTGPMTLGHHAMLRFPDEYGPGRIALSPWRHGRVYPVPFESPARGGYAALRTDASFRSLRAVPLAAGGTTDVTTYPAREGFEDLLMVSARPPRAGRPPVAWTTVTYPKRKFVWFALKDPRVLASTILWHSNGGRHYPPWNGRHRRVLGLEEVTSYFDRGLAASAAPNPLSRAGVPTVHRLRPTVPLWVNYIFGVAAVPAGFDVVRRVLPRGDHIVLCTRSGHRARHPVDLSFLAPPA